MCGITGWIDWQADLSEQNHVVKRMTATLHLRGPDDTSTWCSKHIGLGHTRLVVVDPVGGKQPMVRFREATEDEVVLVYNGELYNTEKLRKELLLLGYRFQGHSDTEVLLTSYLQWGTACVHKLNGIFAFAIWDSSNQQAFLARDRLGVKPLFYRQHNSQLLFGSEIKALLAHPQVKARVDDEGLAELFGLGPARTPGHGIFYGLHELRPGHALIYSRERFQIHPYWQLKSEKHCDDLETTQHRVRDLVHDAITRQLVADVPVCTFLSGGLDSSAITAIAAKSLRQQGRGPLHTYSIDYQDNEQYFQADSYQPNSDSHWIDIMSQAARSIHHSFVIPTKDLVAYLKMAVIVRDQPGMADIDSSLLWFCQQVKKEATVALSGECADEIFGGYPWFHNPDQTGSDHFPWMQSTSARKDLLQPKWQKKLNIKQYVTQRYLQTLKEVPHLTGESASEAKRRELFYLNIVWFMTTLLDRKDRMSMGASLEVRVPFADHHLVEYVWNIPWEFKAIDAREKGILRRALTGILPSEILNRKKSPYPKTHNPIYTKAVRDWLSEIIATPHAPLLELVSKEKLIQLIETDGQSFNRPWFGQLMTGPQLMAYLAQVNTWFEHYNIQVH